MKTLFTDVNLGNLVERISCVELGAISSDLLIVKHDVFRTGQFVLTILLKTPC